MTRPCGTPPRGSPGKGTGLLCEPAQLLSPCVDRLRRFPTQRRTQFFQRQTNALMFEQSQGFKRAQNTLLVYGSKLSDHSTLIVTGLGCEHWAYSSTFEAFASFGAPKRWSPILNLTANATGMTPAEAVAAGTLRYSMAFWARIGASA